MKLCGFEVGIDHPVFLIAGRVRRAEQGPRKAGMRPQRTKRACDFSAGSIK